jgi:hypothetical protein
MGYVDQTTTRERPAIGDTADAEIEALYSMLIVVSAARRRAFDLMRDYPRHASVCQAIVDFATDGEGDIRGAIAKLDDEAPHRRDRSGPAASRARPYRGGGSRVKRSARRGSAAAWFPVRRRPAESPRPGSFLASSGIRGRISCNSGLTGAAEGRSPRYA